MVFLTVPNKMSAVPTTKIVFLMAPMIEPRWQIKSTKLFLSFSSVLKLQFEFIDSINNIC